MDKDNFIIVKDGLSDVKIFMDENFFIWLSYVKYPNIPPLRKNFEIREWLVMIDSLKNQKPSFEGEKESPFQNRWEEINNCVASCDDAHLSRKIEKKSTSQAYDFSRR